MAVIYWVQALEPINFYEPNSIIRMISGGTCPAALRCRKKHPDFSRWRQVNDM